MKKTLFSLLTLSLIVLSVSGCAVFSRDNKTLRTLNVTSSGEIRLSPDIARVNIGVQSKSQEIADAFNENNASTEAVIAKMIAMGVNSEDLQTSNFYIYTIEDYSQPFAEDSITTPQMTYVVENTVSVLVRDLDSLGDILSAAVAEGANTIYGVTFDISDQSATLVEARQMAIQNAKDQAQAVANAAGVRLGDIHTISIYEGEPVSIERAAAMDIGVGGSGVPIEGGNLAVRVSANLTFQID